MNGLLILDKPAGLTSHDIVARTRRILGERSIGHLGTLDPMATGVLPMLLGRYTRLAQFFGRMEKSYTGTIRFGQATTTYDAEGGALQRGTAAEAASLQCEEGGWARCLCARKSRRSGGTRAGAHPGA